MRAEYWVALGCILFAIMIIRRVKKSSRKVKVTPEAKGILEFRGDCVYVSPMAIVSADERDVNVEKIDSERLDRVVRLRIVEIMEAIHDPSKKLKDQVEIDRLRRMATVHSAVTGQHIHKSLMLVDYETKALYLGVLHRQELVTPDRKELDRYSSRLSKDRDFMQRMGSIEYAVKLEFLSMMGKNEYAYFHHFATAAYRRSRRGNMHNNFRDDEIQSAITAFAIRLGFMIPRSYVRYDAVTAALVNWDLPEVNRDQNVVYLNSRHV